MLLHEDHGSLVKALAFSPDGSRLASGARDGAALIRDSTGAVWPLVEPGPKPAAIHSLAFLPTGPIAVGHDFGWDLYREAGGGWQLFGTPVFAATTALAALSAGIIALGTGDRHKPTSGTFELYDTRADRRLEPFFREPNGVRAVAACPEKMLVAWATGHKELKVWDLRKQTPSRFPASRTSAALALAPDGSALAATQDWAIRLIDLGLNQERAVLKGHKGIVCAVAFSPDGATVATGSWDQTVRLWDAASGRERAVFQWPIGKVFSLAYAPDGLRLAAGGERGSVVVWDL